MRKIIVVFLVCFWFFPGVAEAQNVQQAITRFLPHFAAGSLPASEWETSVNFFNSTAENNSILVELFDSTGNPLVVATSKGVGDKFGIVLGPNASDTVTIFRNNGFVSGWAKTTSFTPYGASLSFSQFVGGTLVGSATVLSSPTVNVLSFPLDRENGVALTNPGSQNANGSFTAFNKAGQKIKEGTFGFVRGGHFASYFREAPFFVEDEGTIVISSNIPISGMGLDFDGLVFKTLPSLPTPRKLDSIRSGVKIGFFYLNSNDRPPMDKEKIQKGIAEAIYFQKTLLDKEMVLNGFSPIENIPYDLEENGLPKVVMVQGENREQYWYSTPDKGVDAIDNAIKGRIPENWGYQVIFVDAFTENQGTVLAGGGGWFEGRLYLNAREIPLMDRKFFGDNSPCPHSPVRTKSDCANNAFTVFNHEAGHAFWALGHSSPADDSNQVVSSQMRFRSMMGPSARDGCFNPEQTGKGECILLPVEAEGIARGSTSRLNDFGWITEDESVPSVQILSKEFDGSRLKLVFSTDDSESGISSVYVTTNSNPFVQFWRQIDHRDNLSEMTIEATLKASEARRGLGLGVGYVNLVVLNNQGRYTIVNLY